MSTTINLLTEKNTRIDLIKPVESSVHHSRVTTMDAFAPDIGLAGFP